MAHAAFAEPAHGPELSVAGLAERLGRDALDLGQRPGDEAADAGRQVREALEVLGLLLRDDLPEKRPSETLQRRGARMGGRGGRGRDGRGRVVFRHLVDHPERLEVGGVHLLGGGQRDAVGLEPGSLVLLVLVPAEDGGGALRRDDAVVPDCNPGGSVRCYCKRLLHPGRKGTYAFESMPIRSPIAIASAPPEPPSPITTAMSGTLSSAMTSRLVAMASDLEHVLAYSCSRDSP